MVGGVRLGSLRRYLGGLPGWKTERKGLRVVKTTDEGRHRGRKSGPGQCGVYLDSRTTFDSGISRPDPRGTSPTGTIPCPT